MARGWLTGILLCSAALAQAAGPAVERQAELRNLLLQDCGSCHGMTLKGGLGPALTRSALQGKSRESLRIVIRDGRPGTPMPPWDTQLLPAEIDWLVDQLLQGAVP